MRERKCDRCGCSYDINKVASVNVITVYTCNVPVVDCGKTGDYVLCDDCMRCLLAFMKNKKEV